MDMFKDNEWYLINGTPCQYQHGVFYWDDEDGTKYFFASRLKYTDSIVPMNK